MVGSSSTTRTAPLDSSATAAIVVPGLAEGEGIAHHPGFGFEPQHVLPDPRQVDEAVEALRIDVDDAFVDVGAGGAHFDRPAVEQDPHVAGLTGRAEHQVNPAGAEVEVERAA